MESTDFKVRTLMKQDVQAAMVLSDEAGWNQTLSDWTFLTENPLNICIAALNHDEIIATTTAMCYSHQLAWIGMVLVKKDYRGKGISKLLLHHVLTKLQSFPSIKLDATALGHELYNKFGFADEYAIARMVTNAADKMDVPGVDITPEQIQPQHIPGIIAMDELVFGVNRGRLIETLYKLYPQKAWVLVRGNQISGFALGREGRNLHQIGPLTATTMTDAGILIQHALSKLIVKPVVLDIPCDKELLIHSLVSTGFNTQRYFTRMYKTGNPFPGISSYQYAICGPEFG